MKLIQQGSRKEEIQKDLIKALVKALGQIRHEELTKEEQKGPQQQDYQPSAAEINQTRREIATILLHLRNVPVRSSI